MFSNKCDEYSTPKKFFQMLEKKFGKFTLDPCASADNTKCSLFYSKEDNGLLKSWKGNNVFCNPPYSNNKEWIPKCFKEAQQK